MPLTFISEDITKVAADAIVNAANPQLRAGGGVCGAIFRAAGYEKLQSACDRIGGCQTGQAVITEGFALPAKYVIHTVGPGTVLALRDRRDFCATVMKIPWRWPGGMDCVPSSFL